MNIFDVDSVEFSGMLRELVTSGESKMAAWEFDENGDVFPEDQERYDDLMDQWDEYDDDDYDDYDDYHDDGMDGDWDSGMTSAGWGTDEDYGYYGEDY